MIAEIRELYQTVKAAIFGTPVESGTAPEKTVTTQPSLQTSSTPVTEPTGTLASVPAPAGLEDWAVYPYTDPTFEKIGRVYLDTGDLIIRSDRDSRGFLVVAEDLDAALTGGTGTVRLLDTLTSAGTAHLSTSGLALNIVIDGQLHTVPMKSLMRVMTGANRKAPLFVPAEDVAPDGGG